MNERANTEQIDAWDCLYCKMVESCPYGQSAIKDVGFSQIADCCSERFPRPDGDPLPEEVRERLTEMYGTDSFDEMDEITRLHKRFF